jgi:putative CocE/NonD family hydrolase
MVIRNLVVDRDVMVSMRDGARLATDVYRPATGAWPALLCRTPYGKEYWQGTLAAVNPITACSRGFAVVIQDVRGRRASEGEFDPFRNEANDGRDTITWLSAQPWCDGRMGMFGSSYMAATQLQAAIGAPKSLVAFAAVQASSDYYEGRTYRGGAFEIGAMLGLALYSLGMSDSTRLSTRAQLAQMRRRVQARLDNLSDLAVDVLNNDEDSLSLLDHVAPFFRDWRAHRTEDAYWRSLSIEPHYSEIGASGLHISSWYDAFHVGTIKNWAGIRRAGTAPQFLLVGPWGHYPPRTALAGTATVGEATVGLGAVLDLEEIQLRWFGHVLHAEDSWHWPAPVRLFLMGANEWRWEDDFPPGDVMNTPLFLAAASDSPGGLRLRWEPPNQRSVGTFVYDPADPVTTMGGAHLMLESQYLQGRVDQRVNAARPDVLVYTSSPIQAAIELVGWVRTRLYVQSSAPCTDFTATLVDMEPSGRVLNICDGIRRADLNQDGPTTEIIIEMGATAIRIPAGHRLGLHISSSNFPRFDVNPNVVPLELGLPAAVRATQTVHHGGVTASAIELPVRGPTRHHAS